MDTVCAKDRDTARKDLRGTRVLIAGAGIAGPALAYWLARYGAEPTVVEIASSPRTGGFAVDFRDPMHMDVLERMSVLDALRKRQTPDSAITDVDEHDHELFRLPAMYAGSELVVYRSDLASLLYDRSAATTEYVFADTPVAIQERDDGVDVTFARGSTRKFDLVIGADGLHSSVRSLVFGAEAKHVRQLGQYVAAWDLPNTWGVDATYRRYVTPGRIACVTADPRNPQRAIAFLVFDAPDSQINCRDSESSKQLIQDIYAGLPWHIPQLLESMHAAPELYFDARCRVQVPRWARGRVALLGDAAWGVNLDCMGVGTGIVGAYVLAGELARAGGDYRRGYGAYEAWMRKYAARWQSGDNVRRLFAPKHEEGLWLRNTLFGMSSFQELLAFAQPEPSGLTLPTYATCAASG